MSAYDSYRDYQRQESFAREIHSMRRMFHVTGSANAVEPLTSETTEKSTNASEPESDWEDEMERSRR